MNSNNNAQHGVDGRVDKTVEESGQRDSNLDNNDIRSVEIASSGNTPRVNETTITTKVTNSP